MWDPVGQAWVAMQQPTLEADSVTVAGTITVEDGGGSLTVDGPLTDAQLRASNVGVSVANFPATQPVSGTVTANQGTPNTAANYWPTSITDGVDTAVVTGDDVTEATPKGVMVGGWNRETNRAFALPLLSQNYYQPTGNTLAIPVDIRSAQGLHGGTGPRTNTILVGGRTNIASPLTSQLVFGNGETLSTGPPSNTFALQVRELGQSFASNGSLGNAGARATISNRYVNWSAGIFTLVANTFTGTMRPVVSLNNGSTWAYCSAFNVLTGELVTTLTNSEASGTFVIPFASGSTDYGWEMTTWTAGSVTTTWSANTSINSLFTASGITKVVTGQGQTLLFGTISQGAAGTTSLVAANATKKVKLVSYSVTLDAAGSFKFTDGTADLTGVIPVTANQNITMAGQVSSHLLETAAINRALSITTVTGKAFGHFSYFLEA